MGHFLRFNWHPKARPNRSTGSLILWYYLTGVLTLVFAAVTTALIQLETIGRSRDAQVFRHLNLIDAEADNVSRAAAGLLNSPSQRSNEVYIAHLRRSLTGLESAVSSFPHGQTETELPLTRADWPSFTRVEELASQCSEWGYNLAKRYADQNMTATDQRILAHNILSSAEELASSVDELRNGHRAANERLSYQRSGVLRGLMAVLVIAMVFQCLAVFRPLNRQFDKRQAELQAFKQQAETTLRELTQRNNETKKQQAELEERLNENQVISENFRIATQRLQKVLASVPIPCIGIDVEGRVYEWNSAAERQFGYAHFDLFEMPIQDFLIGPEDRKLFVEKIADTIRLDQSVTFEMPATSRDEGRMLCEWNMMPMRGANGEITSLVLTANDVTERVLQQERLKELAYKDALTGLCNRRSFLQTMSDKWDSVAESNPMTVILMDVDKFKVYNDTHGHPAGDALLRRVGEILTACSPTAYLPARYGGEEFIVLMPGATEDEGVAFAEQLRAAIEAKTQDLHGATASFGVATIGDVNFGSQDLIQGADLALYQSKHNGRNRVTLWNWAATESDPNAEAA